MPRSDENNEALRKAEAAEAIARADDNGMAQPVFKDTAQAFDAGVNAGYAQCLDDLTKMLEQQTHVHQQRMRGVRVNL